MIRMVGVIDLFSGIGGLGLGFKMAGFDVELAVEINPRRAMNYKYNIRPRKIIVGDVRKIDFSEYRDIDGIIAGPPCQPYSNATPMNRKGINHPYFGLDLEVIRVVKQIIPHFVVIEEVPAWNPGTVINELRKLGYAIHAEIYDMSNYGVPMKRRRWIVIAVKGRLNIDFTIPMEKPPKPIDVLANLPPDPCTVDPCKWDGKIVYNHVNSAINSKLSELVPKIPPGYSLSKAHKAGIIDASKYVKDVSKKHSYWMYRIHPDNPLPTIPSPRRSILLHPIYNRMITVRELARLYTFPDTFILKSMSIDEMYNAITDSVPPKFATKIVTTIKVFSF